MLKGKCLVENYFGNLLYFHCKQIHILLKISCGKNRKKFQSNADIQNLNTGYKYHLHMPNANLYLRNIP